MHIFAVQILNSMKTTVGVLFGGRSVENEISVVTAIQAVESLDKSKYDVVPIYIAKNGKWYSGPEFLDIARYRDLPSLLKPKAEVYFRASYGERLLYHTARFAGKPVRIDVILPALHGTNCEDGTVQGVLETIGIPYVGCNTFASANGMDKISMKQILRSAGVPVVDFVWFSDKEWDEDNERCLDAAEKQLEYPVIVKPANSGSSVGIRPAHNREELGEAVRYAAQFTTRVIVEKMLDHLKEVNCSVLGDYHDCKPSVCEVPLRSGEILTYNDKYMDGGSKGGAKGAKIGGAKGGAKSQGMRSTKRELPANIPQPETDLIRNLAVKTFRTLACEGVARIDFMIDETDRRVYVNEINTIPGSLSSYLWECSGIPFSQVLDILIARAFARRREEEFKTVDFGGNIFAK